MDKIILGLLMLSSRTIYEIKSRIAQGLELMYSSSTGSIQAAIKKLMAQGYIIFNEEVENGKYKKIYSITESGRTEFLKWVNSSFSSAQNKKPELVKLYFMGLSDVQTRKCRISEYIKSLEESYATLKFIYDSGEDMVVQDEYKDLFNYQRLTAKFGIDSIRFEIEWYKQLLSDIDSGRI